MPASLVERDPVIFHIHGLARINGEPCGDNLVLARSDFDNAYNEYGLLRAGLIQLLTYYDFIFIACNLSEPMMHHTFQEVHKIQDFIRSNRPGAPYPTQKYLLKGQCPGNDEREFYENDRFKAMNIEVIGYSAHGGSHSELVQILEDLCEFCKIKVTPELGIGID
jgi:hypothetical protein